MNSVRLMTTGLLGILLVILAPDAVVAQPSPRIAGYQVGAFGFEANAKALLKKLGDCSFFGEVHQKSVNDAHFWVVVVPMSDIPFENVRQKLLDAGFPVLDVSKDDWVLLES